MSKASERTPVASSAETGSSSVPVVFSPPMGLYPRNFRELPMYSFIFWSSGRAKKCSAALWRALIVFEGIPWF